MVQQTVASFGVLLVLAGLLALFTNSAFRSQIDSIPKIKAPWQRLLMVSLVLVLLLLNGACQPSNTPPTLQPGEVEVPFETIVLDEEGVAEITEGSPTYLILSQTEAMQLQPLISSEAFRLLQSVDFVNAGVIALFRVPRGGCAGLGVTIDRLTLREETLTVHATDWRPPNGHACAQTSRSAYHLVQVRKVNANLEELALVLQIQGKERSD